MGEGIRGDIGVPSKGSNAANFVSKLPSLLTGRPVLDLQTTDTNTFLTVLEDLWWSVLKKPLRPLVFCAYEKKSTFGITVVPDIYTDTRCDNVPRAENEDHSSIVKPVSVDADIYEWVRGRISEIAKTAKPTQSSLDPKTPSTLYIKRIFNEPRGPSAQNTIVWLGATGAKTIIVDSVHIVHHPSALASGFSGAVGPVANYKITYEPGSDEIYPLNPALVLDPADPKDISFTMDIAPSRGVSGASTINVTLLFRSEDGEAQGGLSLIQPSRDQVALAKLLNQNVVLTGAQVVTPQSFQRLQLPSDDRPVNYIPISAPSFHFDKVKIWNNLHGYLDAYGDAVRIVDIIKSQEKLPAVASLVKAQDRLGFALCAILGAECRKQLYDAVLAAKDPSQFWDYLAISDIVSPSDHLETLLRQQPTLFDRKGFFLGEDNVDRLLYALASHPTEHFFDVLEMFKDKHPSTIDALYARRDILPKAMVDDFLKYGLELSGNKNSSENYIRTAMKVVFYLEPSDVDTYALFDERAPASIIPTRGNNTWETQNIVQRLNEIGGAQILANLAAVAVVSAGEVITPDQAISGPEEPYPVIVEKFPYLILSDNDLSRKTPDHVVVPEAPGRRLLWTRILRNSAETTFYNFIRNHSYSTLLPIEVLAESGDRAKTRDLLISLCADPVKRESALRSLARLQLTSPDPEFPEQYLRYNKDVGKGVLSSVHWGYTPLEIGTSLWARRMGRWDVALVTLMKNEADNYYPPALLYSAREDLSSDAINMLRTIVSNKDYRPPGYREASVLLQKWVMGGK
jgi:hypothetical protein